MVENLSHICEVLNFITSTAEKEQEKVKEEEKMKNEKEEKKKDILIYKTYIESSKHYEDGFLFAVCRSCKKNEWFCSLPLK